MILEELELEKKYLTKNCFIYGEEINRKYNRSDFLTPESINNIERARYEICHIIKKYGKTFASNNIGSYGAKHVLEAYRGIVQKYGNPYISNGEFILASLIDGCEIKVSKGSPNARYKVKFYDISEL